MELVPANNPFSTRRTRPGAIAFRFEDGEEAGTVVERLRSNEWWGQIVGPHGSGKSTLLATLLPALEAAGRRVQLIALHEGERRLPLVKDAWRGLSASTQIIVDGYEQLGPFARWSLTRRCRRCGCGLLVTTHRDLGLPTIWTMNPRLELAKDLVRDLLPPGDETIADRDIESAWHARHGNLREALFDLYDLFEQRQPEGREA
ncbi:MAG TPA: hypothetical protein VNH11_08400 [Pirellulales bacterium]|nr:hypothetical protein [Pirellulales bacterium]